MGKKKKIKQIDPERFEWVKKMQEQIPSLEGASIMRICPYCKHKLSILANGQHDAEERKCDHCNEPIKLPCVSIG